MFSFKMSSLKPESDPQKQQPPEKSMGNPQCHVYPQEVLVKGFATIIVP